MIIIVPNHPYVVLVQTGTKDYDILNNTFKMKSRGSSIDLDIAQDGNKNTWYI
jgi:hypothetical protein